MIWLISVIFIAAMLIWWKFDRYADTGLFFCGIIGGVILVITVSFLILSYPYKINERLNMYEEENSKIEYKVKETVQAYMNYEQETYKNLVETTNLETLLVKYPELNSNALVKSEIETYTENNKEIKKLKEQQIYKSVFDFWLKFNIGD